MDPEPTANPHAELVMECFEEPPATETAALGWSPIMPPDLMLARRSGWCGVDEAAVEKGDEFFQKGEIVDVLIDEGRREENMLPSPWICLPRLVGQGGGPVGLGQQKVVVEDRIRWDLTGSCTLPSLKELGLDIYVRNQDQNES